MLKAIITPLLKTMNLKPASDIVEEIRELPELRQKCQHLELQNEYMRSELDRLRIENSRLRMLALMDESATDHLFIDTMSVDPRAGK